MTESMPRLSSDDDVGVGGPAHATAQDRCVGPVTQIPDMLNGLMLPPSAVHFPSVNSPHAPCWYDPTNVMPTLSLASITVQPCDRPAGWPADKLGGVEFGLCDALLSPQPPVSSIEAMAATATMISFIIPRFFMWLLGQDLRLIQSGAKPRLVLISSLITFSPPRQCCHSDLNGLELHRSELSEP